MKKLTVMFLLIAACSDDSTSTAAKNNQNDAGLTTPDAATDTQVDVTPDAETDAPIPLDAQLDVAADTETDAGFVVDLSPLGGDRPVEPTVPNNYDPNEAHPLVVVLHGYGATGNIQKTYFQLAGVQDEFKFVMIAPDGTRNSSLQQFWNATDYCCDLENTQVDDATYLANLIAEAKTRFNIDDKRVFLIGHSNGGFMSYRMACDYSEIIAGIVSLAGAMHSEPSDCDPSEPVAVAQVHGTADAVVYYAGLIPSLANSGYPSASSSVEFWRNFNGCDADPSSRDAIDISAELGAETDVEFHDNCRQNGAAELWSMNLAPHIPGLNADFPRKTIEFLMAHPKP